MTALYDLLIFVGVNLVLTLVAVWIVRCVRGWLKPGQHTERQHKRDRRRSVSSAG